MLDHMVVLGFLGGSVIKKTNKQTKKNEKQNRNSPVNAGDTRDEVLIPGLERPSGWEDPLVKEMATHSSMLAWENLMNR